MKLQMPMTGITNANDWKMQDTENELTPMEYWRQVQDHKLKPIYGADIAGTLFDPEVSQWNLSCVKSILVKAYGQGPAAEGVLLPSLCYGTKGSTFALHTEDMDMYSINYLHWGKPKRWNGVPPAYVRKVENLMADEYSSDFKKFSGSMRHKSVLINPETLRENGIPCGSRRLLWFHALSSHRLLATVLFL